MWSVCDVWSVGTVGTGVGDGELSFGHAPIAVAPKLSHRTVPTCRSRSSTTRVPGRLLLYPLPQADIGAWVVRGECGHSVEAALVVGCKKHSGRLRRRFAVGCNKHSSGRLRRRLRLDSASWYQQTCWSLRHWRGSTSRLVMCASGLVRVTTGLVRCDWGAVVSRRRCNIG